MVLGSHTAKPVKAFLKAEKAEDVVKFSWYLKQRRKDYYWLNFCSVIFISYQSMQKGKEKGKKRRGKKKKKSQQGTEMT